MIGFSNELRPCIARDRPIRTSERRRRTPAKQETRTQSPCFLHLCSRFHRVLSRRALIFKANLAMCLTLTFSCFGCIFFVMKMELKKAVSIFALSTMLLVSFAIVCKQMLVSCALDCTKQTTMEVMGTGMQMDGCTQNSSAYSTSMKDHMTFFASVYPSTATSSASPLLSIVVAVFFFAWLAGSRASIESIISARLRVRLRSLARSLSNFVAPDFLVFAFSRGILNSKIYA